MFPLDKKFGSSLKEIIMVLRDHARQLKSRIDFIAFRLQNNAKERFECPVCGYAGPFMDVTPVTGVRKHAACPNCHALERHRIQFLVVEEVLKEIDTTHLRMLHFAPEPFFREYFSNRFVQYETADLSMKGVDYNVDIQKLPFDENVYDFVFASHVLEHIPDDEKALSEIRRILKPNGVAILPVPIVADKTVEYSAPNPYEDYHVRAPGLDYFDRYEHYFSRVDKFRSDAWPEKYQLFVFENRSQWPTEECPLRPSMRGPRHVDIVPVCYA
ncbi:MAG: class I SAM-dependent methyltransferase [Cyanobacteria bacterium J06623_4]